jgi:hypothetical protein
MIQILRGTPEQVLWQATLVLHALAPAARAELGEGGAVIALSAEDKAGLVTREVVAAADLPAELVRHAAARLAKLAVVSRADWVE